MAKEMIAVMCRCSKTKKLFGMRFDKVGKTHGNALGLFL